MNSEDNCIAQVTARQPTINKIDWRINEGMLETKILKFNCSNTLREGAF